MTEFIGWLLVVGIYVLLGAAVYNLAKIRIINSKIHDKVESDQMDFKWTCPEEGCDFLVESNTPNVLPTVRAQHVRYHDIQKEQNHG